MTSSKTYTLEPGFSISEATKNDMPEIWQVFLSAFEDYKIWRVIVNDLVNPDELKPWVCSELGPRWLPTGIIVHKITENASEKIVGWGALQIPFKYQSSESVEQIKAEIHSKITNIPDGMNKEALWEFMAMDHDTDNFGYDPENHYHQRGLMIHPEYQRKGFGSILTQYYNTMVDSKGDHQYVQAWPKSNRMFRKHGFKEIGEIGSRFEQWGEPGDTFKVYVLLRPPTVG